MVVVVTCRVPVVGGGPPVVQVPEMVVVPSVRVCRPLMRFPARVPVKLQVVPASATLNATAPPASPEASVRDAECPMEPKHLPIDDGGDRERPAQRARLTGRLRDRQGTAEGGLARGSAVEPSGDVVHARHVGERGARRSGIATTAARGDDDE